MKKIFFLLALATVFAAGGSMTEGYNFSGKPVDNGVWIFITPLLLFLTVITFVLMSSNKQRTTL